MIITAIYKDDWRQAQDYLSKIEEKETRNGLYKKIFSTAIAEYKKLISNAKQFNKLNKFDESKSELERADFIADRFPDSDLLKEKNKISSNLLLLDRKRKAQPEVNSIEKKINDISLQLKNFQITDESGITDIEGQVIDKEKNPSIIVLKKLGSKKHIAVSGDVSYYNVGEFVSITCKKVGMVSYGDEDITEYATYSRGILNFDKTEKESLFIELNNLKTRKQKLDSLINLSLN